MSQSPIIFVHGSLGLGGAEILRASILEEFARQKIPARVCVLRTPGPLADKIRSLGFPVDVLNNRGGLFDVKGVARLSRYLALHRPVVVQASQFLTNLHSVAATRSSGNPVTVIEEHGLYTWKKWRHRLLDRFVCSNADAVVACSARVASFARQSLKISHDRVHVIHNCVGHEHFRPRSRKTSSVRSELGGNEGRFIVGTIGTLRWEKGHRYLLQAWRQLHERSTLPKDALLVIVGDGPLNDDLRAEAADHPNIVFLGGRSDTAAILDAMDLFVLPSLNEGFGIAIAEAMCAGVPVVSTTSGGIPEVVTSERTGLLVPPADSTALAVAIARMYNDRHFREQCARSAQMEAVKRFHPRNYVASLRNLYCLLLRKKGLDVPEAFSEPTPMELGGATL